MKNIINYIISYFTPVWFCLYYDEKDDSYYNILIKRSLTVELVYISINGENIPLNIHMTKMDTKLLTHLIDQQNNKYKDDQGDLL